MLPPEVTSFGRHVARRVGLDDPDGISHAAQAWADHPDCWKTVALRRGVDQRRHESGKGAGEHRPLVVLDEPRLIGGMTVGESIACEERGFAQVEARCDLAALLGGLPDEELAALARHHWLGLPVGRRNSTQAVTEARAMRHARGAHRGPPEGCPLSVRELQVLAAMADGLTARDRKSVV